MKGKIRNFDWVEKCSLYLGFVVGLIVVNLCRTLREMMRILASTREKFFWLSMLPPNGIVPHTLVFILFYKQSRKTKPIYSISFSMICGSGLTNSNYTELNELYQKYKDQGLHFQLILFSLWNKLICCLFHFHFLVNVYTHFFLISNRLILCDKKEFLSL